MTTLPDAVNVHAVTADAPTADVLTDLDRRITAAHRHLGVSRARFSDAPSGEGVTVCEAAEAALDELLDQRLLLAQNRARPAVA